MSKLKEHQRLNKYNEIWIIRNIVLGKSYDKVYPDTMRKAFLTTLIGVELINKRKEIKT